MGESFEIIIADIIGIIKVTRVTDLTSPIGFLLWSWILLFPLYKIDRRDKLAAATYVLFCMGAGVSLVYALPQSFTQNPSIQTQVVVTILMGLVALARWVFKWEHIFAGKKMTQKSFDEEDKKYAESARRSAEANKEGDGEKKPAA